MAINISFDTGTPVFSGTFRELPPPATFVHTLALGSQSRPEEERIALVKRATRAVLRAADASEVSLWLKSFLAFAFDGDARRLESLEDANPKRYCGYVFREGDICWNCRTCEKDSTCVQCDACFQLSDHTGHDVFFHKASPNGCCDCGDEEAWAWEGCCPRHRRRENEELRDPLEVLDPFFAKSARAVVEAARDVLVTLLIDTVQCYEYVVPQNTTGTTAEAARSMPANPHLDQQNDGDIRVYIHNDDWHTYDEIISLLHNCALRRQQAIAVTEQVDSSGEAEVNYGNAEHIRIPRARSFEYARYCLGQAYKDAVITSVCTGAELLKHSLAQSLLDALTELAGINDGVMRIIGEVFVALNEPPGDDRKRFASGRLGLAEEVGGDGALELVATPHIARFRPPHVERFWASREQFKAPSTALVMLWMSDPLLPKTLRKAVHAFLMKMLADTVFFRVKCAEALRAVYPLLSDHFAHGVGVERDSAFNITVQIFTTPSVVTHLCRADGDREGFEDVVSVLAKSLKRAFDTAKRNPPSALTESRFRRNQGNSQVDLTSAMENAWLEDPFVMHSRYNSCGMSDLGHCFRAPGAATLLVRNRRVLECVLLIFRQLHLMDPFARQVGSHVEFETMRWANAFNMALAMGDFSLTFFKGLLESAAAAAAEDLPVDPAGQADWAKLFSQTMAQLRIIDGTRRESFDEPSSALCRMFVHVDDPTALFRNQNILRTENSIHTPFHRFIGLAVTSLGSFDDATCSFGELLEVLDLGFSDAALLCDFPLRSLCVSALSGLHMFRRNGLQFEHMMASYGLPPFCRLLRDPDIRCIQFGLLVLARLKRGVDFGVAFMMNKFLSAELLLNLESEVEKEEAALLPNRNSSREFLLGMVEAFLDTLIVVCTELPMPLEETVRREVLHALIEEDLPYSAILKAVRVLGEVTEALVGTVLGDLCERTEGELALFRLKAEYRDLYDPSFWHLPRRSHESAARRLEELLAAKPSKDKTAKKRWPPRPYVAAPPSACNWAFKAIRNDVLYSDITLTAARNAVFRAVRKTEGPDGEVVFQLGAPRLVAKALQILTLQIHQLHCQETTDAQRTRFAMSMVEGEEDGQSIMRLMYVLQGKVDEGGILHRGVLWFLQETFGMATTERSFDGCGLAATLLTTLGYSSGAKDDESEAKQAERLKRRKRAQALALRKMQKRQQAFASHMGDLEETDAGETKAMDVERSASQEKTGGSTTLDGDADVCIMCHTHTDEPIAYMGFAQRSGLFAHLHRKRQLATRDPAVLRHTVVNPEHAQLREGISLTSPRCQIIEEGREVVVEETCSRRGRVVAPAKDKGWASIYSDNHFILAPSREVRRPSKWGTEKLCMGSCGHAVHYTCWDGYLASQTSLVEGGTAVACNVAKGEALCPLCKQLVNVLIPHIPSSFQQVQKENLANVRETAQPRAPSVDAQPLVEALGETYAAESSPNEALLLCVKQLATTLLERTREEPVFPLVASDRRKRFLYHELRDSLADKLQEFQICCSALSVSMSVTRVLTRQACSRPDTGKIVWGLIRIEQNPGDGTYQQYANNGPGSELELQSIRRMIAATRYGLAASDALRNHAVHMLRELFNLETILLPESLRGELPSQDRAKVEGLARLLAQQSLCVSEQTSRLHLLQQAVLRKAAIANGLSDALIHPLFSCPMLKWDLSLLAIVTSFFLPPLDVKTRCFTGMRPLLVARVGQVILETLSLSELEYRAFSTAEDGYPQDLVSSVGIVCDRFVKACAASDEACRMHSAFHEGSGMQYLTGRIVSSLAALCDHLILVANAFGHDACPSKLSSDPSEAVESVFSWLGLPPLVTWGDAAVCEGLTPLVALERMAEQLRAHCGDVGILQSTQPKAMDQAAASAMARLEGPGPLGHGFGMQDNWWELSVGDEGKEQGGEAPGAQTTSDSDPEFDEDDRVLAMDLPAEMLSDWPDPSDAIEVFREEGTGQAPPAPLGAASPPDGRVGEGEAGDESESEDSGDTEETNVVQAELDQAYRSLVETKGAKEIKRLRIRRSLANANCGPVMDLSHMLYDHHPFPPLAHARGTVTERASQLAPQALIPLPTSFTTLHKAVVARLRASPGSSNLGDPCICLLCGYVTRERRRSPTNPLRQHAMVCGRGVGVFFMVNQCHVLLVRDGLTVRGNSLYVDAFGEEDINLRRGRPLHLSQERYAKLNEACLSHSLAKETVKFALNSRR